MSDPVYTIQASLLPVSSCRVRVCGGVPTLTSAMYAPWRRSLFSVSVMVPLARRRIGRPSTALRRWIPRCTTPSGVAS
jgi:hypothetical protein